MHRLGAIMSAAGILFAWRGPDGWEVCLAKRSLEPDLGKWYCPGGGVKHGESPWDAATRETSEEWCNGDSVVQFFGKYLPHPGIRSLAKQHVYHSGGWSFTTYLLEVTEKFPPGMIHLNDEFLPDSAEWIAVGDLVRLHEQDLLRYNLVRAARAFGLIPPG
ncbi:NUDIX hydrolase [Tuwongella immobilis]|uniref:Nudix hydrolase domain-containing protein n=1 Tax=Tuwongella immobilis TaxID=692036 RepID=A0A6C2YS08_9BACT|nr:NUDIX hydrolase [Tuwongella immobilis]VIP04137.1 nudix hydrolase : Putative mutator protein MutT OS=Ilumatobacter coccineus YM16-304 GN=mutX PE=3 SV=1: NUDIX [Tuwongella immobilis]VTS05639.1 nudix hydrolase : Putative mutator protein MutT OS=Ilumatobacter coccineus YM16-304 GN=mutX PE=3 SV=1: NUDIX [Tuwongella immobilis]